MAVLSLQHEEILAEKVKGFPVMSKIKVLKEKKKLFKSPRRKWSKV